MKTFLKFRRLLLCPYVRVPCDTFVILVIDIFQIQRSFTATAGSKFIIELLCCSLPSLFRKKIFQSIISFESLRWRFHWATRSLFDPEETCPRVGGRQRRLSCRNGCSIDRRGWPPPTPSPTRDSPSSRQEISSKHIRRKRSRGNNFLPICQRSRLGARLLPRSTSRVRKRLGDNHKSGNGKRACFGILVVMPEMQFLSRTREWMIRRCRSFPFFEGNFCLRQTYGHAPSRERRCCPVSACWNGRETTRPASRRRRRLLCIRWKDSTSPLVMRHQSFAICQKTLAIDAEIQNCPSQQSSNLERPLFN